jgi:cellulose synthase/poly-beta-1,6-N-acetylglucosamine synthase-like glycosyltransferase
MDQISRTRVDLEFSLLDKIIAGAVGRKAMLYREPFQRSGGPISAARVASLEPALDRGLEVVGMDIVPRDWDGWSAREIADFVISEVQNDRGNMILLHDGGKDRSATVEALPLIISGLRDTGYSFTTLANLANTTRADIMPVAEGGYQTLDRVSFSMVAWMRHAVVTAFWVALAIGITRSLAVLVLSVLNWRGRRPVSLVEPRVAVIIPAHNEEKVIRTCIESVRASDYRNLEIIVVDDGSSDNTLTEVFRFSHKQDVRLISQPNQGKWSALNRALLNVDAEIVVCIDADTQIERSAIRHLVKQFNDPKVGAVAGKIMAGNKVNLLTRLQAFEYATSQNVDRRAFDLINGILVVPGALGAWRRSALRKAGLFSDATMTEDTDLTIQVNRAGYRVVYEPRARGYTEVPERIGQLLKQRLRWSFGMFQSAWKHKRAVFEGRMVGLISIPDMFIFGYLFPLLAPIADLFVLVLLYNMVAGGWGELDTTLAAQPTHYLWAYLTLPALEILIAAFALARDEDESLWSLLLFPIHRVFYRPLLYYSVIRAILRAATGRLASWGTQKRLGRDYSLATGGA